MNKKIWDNKDSKLPLVIENASWRFIHDFAGFQTCKGVFILATSAHNVKYVGHTQKNCIIEAIAEAMENGFDTGATMVKVLYTLLDKDAVLIAKILNEKYSPVNNSKVQPVKEDRIITGTNRVS